MRGGFCGYSSWAPEHRLGRGVLGLSRGTWSLPAPGISFASPVLTGRLFTTEPQGSLTRHCSDSWFLSDLE